MKRLLPELRINQWPGGDHLADGNLGLALDLNLDAGLEAAGRQVGGGAELLRVADWRRRPRSHFLEGAMVYHDEWIHVLAQVCGRIAFLPDTLCFYRQHGVNVTGAPGPRLVDVSRDALSVGLDYYRNRGAQAREWSVLFAGLAAAEEDGDRRSRYERGSEAFGRLARSLELRLRAYEPETRASRLAGLVRVLRSGGYGSRRRDGFGVRGLARDALMIALGRGR